MDNEEYNQENTQGLSQDTEKENTGSSEPQIVWYNTQGQQVDGWNADATRYDSNTYQQPTVEVTPIESAISPKNKKEKKSFGRVIAAAIVFGLIAGVVFQGVNHTSQYLFGKKEVVKVDTTKTQISTTKPVKDSETNADAVSTTAGTMDVSSVAENVMPSIVAINSTVTAQGYSFFGEYYNQDAKSSGSGIIVGQNDDQLLIVTNNHVVQDAKSIGVVFIDQEQVEAEVKGTDSSSDLAVIAVDMSKVKEETKANIKVATLGDSDSVKVGAMAIAIGNALGYGQSVTVGYISAKDREISVGESESVQNKMTLIQTDAAINPGNSGGALLNASGQVIGINSAKLASSDIEGMGYAIPISKAVPIINDLMNREVLKENEKGYLGISGITVSDEATKSYGMPKGVYVVEVAKDGACAEADIKKGDIVTKVNDMEVTTIDALKEKANGYRAGTEITLTIKRNTNGEYKESTVKVTLKDEKTLDSLEKNDGDQQNQSESSEGDKGSSDDDSEAPSGSDDIFDFFR